MEPRYANGREISLQTDTRWIDQREFLAIYKIAFRELLRAYQYARLQAGYIPQLATPAYWDYPKLQARARWFATNLGNPQITPSCGLISRVVPGEQLDLAFVASLAAWWANLTREELPLFERDVNAHACSTWPPYAIEVAKRVYYSFMRADPAYQSLDLIELAPIDPYNPLSAGDVEDEVARVTGNAPSGFVPGTVPTTAVPGLAHHPKPNGRFTPGLHLLPLSRPVSAPGLASNIPPGARVSCSTAASRTMRRSWTWSSRAWGSRDWPPPWPT